MDNGMVSMVLVDWLVVKCWLYRRSWTPELLVNLVITGLSFEFTFGDLLEERMLGDPKDNFRNLAGWGVVRSVYSRSWAERERDDQ